MVLRMGLVKEMKDDSMTSHDDAEGDHLQKNKIKPVTNP